MAKRIFGGWLAILLAGVALYGARNRAMQQKPFPGAMVNQAHPWVRGLVAAYVFSEESGTGTADSLHGVSLGTFANASSNPAPWNISLRQWSPSSYSSGTGAFTGAPAGTQGVGGQYRGVKITGDSNGYSAGSERLTGSDQYLPSGAHPFSFVMHVSTAANPDGGAAHVGCIWNYGTSGTTDELRGFRLTNSTTVAWVSWNTDLSGTVATMTSHQSLWISASYDGATARIYYSTTPGRMAQIASGARTYNVVKTGTLTLGKSVWTNEFWDGWYDYLYFYDVAVPLDTLNAITLAPFDMFGTTSPVWPRYNLANLGGTVRHRAISQ